eukprot:TRINITY_DN6763_c1_g1_i1.p1 TRINITY_DN6763_c1_g1~~TRINITY_DN6763_c1_g1_i1.p1  ORF type:complete len:927 (+),score=197.52 TRINITY_DN6763_c1_g1_i1:72-2783(+)
MATMAEREEDEQMALSEVKSLRTRMQLYLDEVELCGDSDGEDGEREELSSTMALLSEEPVSAANTPAGVLKHGGGIAARCATPQGPAPLLQVSHPTPTSTRQHVPRAEWLLAQQSLQTALAEVAEAQEKTQLAQQRQVTLQKLLDSASVRNSELEKANLRLSSRVTRLEEEKARWDEVKCLDDSKQTLTGVNKFVWEKQKALLRRNKERAKIRFMQQCQELVVAQEAALMHAHDGYLTGEGKPNTTKVRPNEEVPIAAEKGIREYLEMPKTVAAMPDDQYVKAKAAQSDYSKFLQDVDAIVRTLAEGLKKGADTTLCSIERQLWPHKGVNPIPRATYGKHATDFMLKGKMLLAESMRKFNQTVLQFVDHEKKARQAVIESYLASIVRKDVGTSPDAGLGKTPYEVELEQKLEQLQEELAMSREHSARQQRLALQGKKKLTISLTYLQDWVMALLRAVYRNLHLCYKHRYRFMARHVDHSVAFHRSPEAAKPRTDLKYNFQLGEMISSYIDTMQAFGEYFRNSNLFGSDMSKPHDISGSASPMRRKSSVGSTTNLTDRRQSLRRSRSPMATPNGSRMSFQARRKLSLSPAPFKSTGFADDGGNDGGMTPFQLQQVDGDRSAPQEEERTSEPNVVAAEDNSDECKFTASGVPHVMSIDLETPITHPDPHERFHRGTSALTTVTLMEVETEAEGDDESERESASVSSERNPFARSAEKAISSPVSVSGDESLMKAATWAGHSRAGHSRALSPSPPPSPPRSSVRLENDSLRDSASMRTPHSVGSGRRPQPSFVNSVGSPGSPNNTSMRHGSTTQVVSSPRVHSAGKIRRSASSASPTNIPHRNHLSVCGTTKAPGARVSPQPSPSAGPVGALPNLSQPSRIDSNFNTRKQASLSRQSSRVKSATKR